MHSLKAIVLVGFLLSISVFSHAEVLSYSQLEECIEMSYDITHEKKQVDQRKQALVRQSNELNHLESTLKGLDWDYDRANDSLRNCQIMNSSNCYAEANRVNSLANQYNSILRKYEHIRVRYNDLIDIHNEELEELRTLLSRSQNQCYRKQFASSDVRRACDGETAHFCKVLK